MIGYITECATAGYDLDWDRFREEAGFTQEMVEPIRTAIGKVGSTELLKPVKEKLPESITYGHIKVYLMMESLALSFPSLPPLDEIKQDSDVSDQAFGSQVLDSQGKLSTPPDLANEGTESTDTQNTSTKSFVKPPWISKESEAATTRPRRRLPVFSSEGFIKRTKVEDF